MVREPWGMDCAQPMRRGASFQNSCKGPVSVNKISRTARSVTFAAVVGLSMGISAPGPWRKTVLSMHSLLLSRTP